jgi:hypothetical protein
LTAANPSHCPVEAESQEAMSSIYVRFADGSKEFLYPSREIKEGDTIWHDGTRYRVLSIAQNDGKPLTLTVEPASDGLGDLLRSEEGALRLDPLTDES